MTSNSDYEQFAQVLGNVLLVTMNEGLVLAQLEALSYFSPMPAKVFLEGSAEIYKKLDKLSSAYGGPPKLLFVEENKKPPLYDTYIEAAIGESIHAFLAARTSVCRTQLYLIGSAMIKDRPDFMHLPKDENIRRMLIKEIEKRFWENAEISYIRLASYWDRMGQMLDFVFFNIRQYERDGFAAVMDRINSNVVPMRSDFGAATDWKSLRAFQISESQDGLKWLVRRRNLLIHSLHLCPCEANNENPLFSSAYNHLEETIKNKLKPCAAEEELNLLHKQLNQAATLFSSAVNMALMNKCTTI